jgi:excisionase family DNA binding protein
MPAATGVAGLERLLTAEEVAERLRVSVFTVRSWLQSGRLRGFKLPGSRSWRVSEADLERFIREAQEQSDGE